MAATSEVDHHGLDPAEAHVLALITEASVAYGALPVQHPDEPREFVDAIHRLQELMAIRTARRCYPLGWKSHA